MTVLSGFFTCIPCGKLHSTSCITNDTVCSCGHRLAPSLGTHIATYRQAETRERIFGTPQQSPRY